MYTAFWRKPRKLFGLYHGITPQYISYDLYKLVCKDVVKSVL